MKRRDPVFSKRFGEALRFTVKIHGAQRRKTGPGEGDGPSYLGHLLGTAALVIEERGSEDEVIAALLHDSIEDTDTTAEDLRKRFGPVVADIVVGCTDAHEKPKPEWRLRKERYLAHLPSASPSVLRVSNADKLYNARTILADLRQHGDGLWRRFNVGAEDTLWYYEELVRIFLEHNPGYLAEELDRVVAEIGFITNEGGAVTSRLRMPR